MKSIGFIIFMLPFITKAQGNVVQPNTDTLYNHYYFLLKMYNENKKDYAVMPYLAYTSKSLKKNVVAGIIAQDYITNYLLKLTPERLYTKENIKFINAFISSTNDRSFKVFYGHEDLVDKTMSRDGYARGVIDYLIAKDFIDPKLWHENNLSKPISEKPKWINMANDISKRFGNEYSARTILNGQLRWYEFKKDTLSLLYYNIQKIDKYGLDTAGFGKMMLNNMIYNLIFLHSNDRAVLDKASMWMEAIIKSDPGNAALIDTYANLLYKSGKLKEALEWEEKAVNLDPDQKDIASNFDKMKKGIKTWPTLSK